MDFGWSREQAELYERILDFSKKRLNKTVRERELAHQFGTEEWKLCGEFGLLGLCVPENYGGMGFGVLDTARAMESFGRGCEDMGLVFSVAAHLFACSMPIVAHGSDEQKNNILPKLCSGEWIAANAITESGAGSDVFSLKSKAALAGESYFISGEKNYVSNGPVADLFVVYASSRPEYGYLGIDAFLVKKGSPGLTVGQGFRKMGLSTAPICSIYLQDCEVGLRDRLGDECQGAQVFNGSMHWERACLFAGYLGMMERQLERTIDFAKQRVQFKRPISKNQSISGKIVDMKMRLEAARLFLYQACWAKDQGSEAVAEIAMSKIAISEAAIQSSLDAIQIHGGLGYMEDIGVEKALRDSIPSTIFSGTSEIQRNIIASRLGL